MKYVVGTGFCALLAIGLVWVLGASADSGLSFIAATQAQAEEAAKAKSGSGKPAKKSGGLAPLVVDKSAPLLLDEPPAMPAARSTDGPVADNHACYVCHANYEEESLVRIHAKEEVGCIKCHGKSFAHRNDEDNITPPDTMYPRDTIDKACHKCHDMHDAPAAKVIARWQARCPTLTDPAQIVCTDCHGGHRLKLRTVRWNKKTKEVLGGEEEREP